VVQLIVFAKPSAVRDPDTRENAAKSGSRQLPAAKRTQPDVPSLGLAANRKEPHASGLRSASTREREAGSCRTGRTNIGVARNNA
jgi:hypothetical protein